VDDFNGSIVFRLDVLDYVGLGYRVDEVNHLVIVGVNIHLVVELHVFVHIHDNDGLVSGRFLHWHVVVGIVGLHVRDLDDPVINNYMRLLNLLLWSGVRLGEVALQYLLLGDSLLVNPFLLLTG